MNRSGSGAAALAVCGAMAVVGICHAAGSFGQKAELEALSGVYASTAPEPWYGGHGTRNFTFKGGTWALTFTHALDGAMQNRPFACRTGSLQDRSRAEGP
ncbi:MAG: hypothetical protein NTZ14_13720 [Hyphomicrobiales bacterium]|nr:hypothetical protein [Hyphomicrobiales bacterium]